MSTWQENRRAAELTKLRAELVRRLDQLDFRFESVGLALKGMARLVERTLRMLST
jgi:hypothetical protein